MNFAVSGILILFLLLPGILFNKAYFQGEFSRKYVEKDFFGLLSSTIIPAIIIYVIAGLYISVFTTYSYNFNALLKLLSSDVNNFNFAVKNIVRYDMEVIYFLLSVNIISLYFGFELRNYFQKFHVDAKDPFLRYQNLWPYLFTGKFALFPNNTFTIKSKALKELDYTLATILMEIEGNAYLYKGIVVGYELGEDGGLNLIYLMKARRGLLKEKEQDFVNINRHILILKYSKITNINLCYIALDKVEDDKSAVATRLINLAPAKLPS